MKRICFNITLLLLIAISSRAQQYKILYINTPTIHIGSRDCKIGNVFYKEDVIQWQDDKQVLKVEDKNSKEQFIICPRMLCQNSVSNTVGAYINVRKSLASRAGVLTHQYELAEAFSMPIDLEQELEVEYTDSTDLIYYIEYEYKGELVPKQLHRKRNRLTITKGELYMIDGQSIPQEPIKVRLYCYDEQKEISELLSETIIIPRCEE